MTVFDGKKNFSYGVVATPPSPASSGTSLVLGSGQGANFPDPATANYNVVVWPAGVAPTIANAEIVRVTGKSTDTLTITRTQESTSARTIVAGDQVMLADTAKVYTDMQTAITTIEGKINNVRARVGLSADSGALTGGAVTKINFNTEQFDTANAYNTSTYKFVAPVAGWYLLGVQLYFYTNITADHVYDAYIYKNGASIARGRQHASHASAMIPTVTTLVHLAANDEIEFYGMQDSGGNTVKVYASDEVSFAFISLQQAD